MQQSRRNFLAGTGAALLSPTSLIAADTVTAKRRIFIVSSYSADYLWSQSTQQGVNAAMLKLGYMSSTAQGDTLVRTDRVETPKAIIRKAWMDSKRRNTKSEIAASTARIMGEIREFRADLIMLGDDNAANYIGNQILGSQIPAVFWGINGLPLKYGLVANMDAPGRNVTGVWQSGYYREGLDLLKRLVPKADRFAILSCDSETTRPSVKMIEQLAQRGTLPLRLVETVITNSFEEFKARALGLSKRVDAFFVLNHDTLRDLNGRHVDMLVVGRWYLENIHVPEVSHEDQFVREGMLLTANDSGFNQGYTAFEMAHLILDRGVNPARMPVRTPDRGPYLVNQNRARQLNISLKDAMHMIDEVVTESVALGKR